MFSNLNIKKNRESIYWIIIIISVIIGIFIRFKGLGKWTLALDEYYIVQSSENILKYGLPQFDLGGYYVRGILMQYLIAPLISLGVKPELAGRIFPLLSNLIAIPAVYLIAKKIGNQLIATLAVVIFSFSIWEIEFARFIRMYAPFQTIFVWYIYLALKDFENKDFAHYKWLLGLSGLSILVYEGSIFLVLLNFVPFIINRKVKFNYLIGSFLVFLASAFLNLYDFRSINAAPKFPPEFLTFAAGNSSDLPLKVPKILLTYSLGSAYFPFFTIVIIAITIYLLWLIIKLIPGKDFFSLFSVIFLGVCAVLNQFGLFLLVFLLFVFWQLIDSRYLIRKVLILFGVIFILNFIYWYAYGMLSKEWFPLFNDFSSYSAGGITKRLLVSFFDYPDNYYSLLNYFRTLPILTLFAAVTLITYFTFLLRNKEQNGNIKFLAGAVIFMGLSATTPTLLYEETRYTFFLVPILLILVLYSAYFIFEKILNKQIFAKISFAILILVVFIFSRDFNLYHIVNIDKQDVNYRTMYNNYYKKHLYRRWDVLTPTDFVKKHMNKNDLIMINENSLEYYLPHVDYFNFNYRHKAFNAISIEQGRKERWSNAKLIYKNEDLIKLIENRETTLWFLIFPEFWFREVDFYNRYRGNLVYQGVDGMIKVFKFPKKVKQELKVR